MEQKKRTKALLFVGSPSSPKIHRCNTLKKEKGKRE